MSILEKPRPLLPDQTQTKGHLGSLQCKIHPKLKGPSKNTVVLPFPALSPGHVYDSFLAENGQNEITETSISEAHKKVCAALRSQKVAEKVKAEENMLKVSAYDEQHTTELFESHQLFREICAPGVHWHARPHPGGTVFFSELHAGTIVNRKSLEENIRLKADAWEQRHVTVPAASRQSQAKHVHKPCSLGVCVCQGFMRRLLARFRHFCNDKLSKEDADAGLMVLSFRAYDNAEGPMRLTAGQGDAGDTHFLHISFVNRTPWRLCFHSPPPW